MAVTDTDPGFDTLAWAQTLREAGVEEKQAEAHAEAARNSRAGLATKADLDALRAELRAANAALRAELRADNAALRAELRADNAALRTELLADNAALRVDNAGMRADIDTLRADMRSDLYRALWIQTGAIVGLVVAVVKFL